MDPRFVEFMAAVFLPDFLFCAGLPVAGGILFSVYLLGAGWIVRRKNAPQKGDEA